MTALLNSRPTKGNAKSPVRVITAASRKCHHPVAAGIRACRKGRHLAARTGARSHGARHRGARPCPKPVVELQSPPETKPVPSIGQRPGRVTLCPNHTSRAFLRNASAATNTASRRRFISSRRSSAPSAPPWPPTRARKSSTSAWVNPTKWHSPKWWKRSAPKPAAPRTAATRTTVTPC